MSRHRRVLTVCGSLRTGSVNEAALRTAAALAPSGVEVVHWRGLVELPHFNPDNDHEPLPAAVADLRSALADVDAVLFCVPEYAGALPGSLKNLLDWTVGGTEVCDLPCGWINVSTAPTGAAAAHASLRTVLGYTGALVVDSACVAVPVSRAAVGSDGLVTDEQARAGIATALTELLAAAQIADADTGVRTDT